MFLVSEVKWPVYILKEEKLVAKILFKQENYSDIKKCLVEKQKQAHAHTHVRPSTEVIQN